MPRRVKRYLVRALLGITIAILVVLGVGLFFYVGARTTNVGKLTFANTLKIPPLLTGHTDARGRKVFDLTPETGRSSFLPGTTTQTWGANGAYLGPTLRASRGDRV